MSSLSDLGKVTRTTEAKDFPQIVLIDNTNACNLRCSMCDHKNMRQYRKIQTMEFDLYTRLIDEIAVENPNARVWEIFFGDPFLCRDMPGRIRYAKEKGLTDVVLNTNGQLMTRNRARAVIEAGLDTIYVGVDAARAETYEQIRVGGKFERAVANVLTYRDLLGELGRDGQKLFVQFVVDDINEAELESFKAFWKREGVAIKVRPKVSWAGLVDATNLRPNQAVNRKPCYWLMQTINICADGCVAFCSVDVHCRVPCGDAGNMSIKDLWEKGPLKAFRQMHLEGRFHELPGMCRNCSDWQSSYAEFHEHRNASQGGCCV